ncbi:cilia- and flagella-associated protein 57-like [Adelges cooleyi]|uniref:cilia- and flagella-associated protein 57-like n=1 Tax=Adelges cooleyi TaxID=133065 RepID=UPI00217F3E8E|nr:cilia- and flagella-associated protein 57-like [Adelges cooleyi]
MVVALAEKGDRPTISIYDLDTLKYRHTLTSPEEDRAKAFVSIDFSSDDIFLAAVTDGPDFMMYYYSWENAMIESSTQAIDPPNNKGPVVAMALNPSDNTIICFVGNGLFRLMTISESVWRQYGFQNSKNIHFTSVCWMNGDRILAGTQDGRVFYVENGDLRAVYAAINMDYIDVKSKMENPLAVVAPPLDNHRLSDIRCCVAFSTGLMFVLGEEKMFFFQKSSDDKMYLKRAVFTIEKEGGILDENISLQTVDSICVSPNEKKMVCATRMLQLYWVSITLTPDIPMGSAVSMRPLSEELHYGGVASLSTCQWKSIFMTCGKIDGAIKVWDYSDCTLLLTQHYQENVFSVSLHPTGLYSLATFISKVEFQLVQMEGLKEWKKFAIMDCNLTAFSNSGHMFALANHHKVDVFCGVLFEHRFTLRGHSGIISAMQWSRNDTKLITCGLDGAIYEFNMRTGEREMDIVHPEIVYVDLAVSKDTSRIFPIAQDGRFREIFNQTMSMTMNDLYLITCSIDGSICIWELKNADDLMIKTDEEFVYLDDILVTMTDVESKLAIIEQLEIRVGELERTYKIDQLREANTHLVQEMRDKNAKIIDSMKKIQTVL